MRSLSEVLSIILSVGSGPHVSLNIGCCLTTTLICILAEFSGCYILLAGPGTQLTVLKKQKSERFSNCSVYELSETAIRAELT